MLELEEELKPYISNYQLNLFDYHKYDSFEFFKGEVKVLFEVLSCVNNKEKISKTFSISEDDARKKVELYW